MKRLRQRKIHYVTLASDNIAITHSRCGLPTNGTTWPYTVDYAMTNCKNCKR